MSEISNEPALSTVLPMAQQEKKLGDRLKALRQAFGLTQEALAEAGGTTRVAINKLETGRNKGSTHGARKALAAAFVVPLEEMNAYLDGDLSLDDFISRRTSRSVRAATPASNDPAPKRLLAAEICLEGGVDPEDVKVVLAAPPNESKTAFQWIMEMAARPSRALDRKSSPALATPPPTTTPLVPPTPPGPPRGTPPGTKKTGK